MLRNQAWWLLIPLMYLQASSASSWIDCEVRARWLEALPPAEATPTLAVRIDILESAITDGMGGRGQPCFDPGPQDIVLDPAFELPDPVASNGPIRLHYRGYSAMGPEGLLHFQTWTLLEP